MGSDTPQPSFPVVTPKKTRKFNCLYRLLLKNENFVQPETPKEMLEFGWPFAPRIRIGRQEWYFNEQSRKHLRNFVNELYDFPQIHSLNSYHSVYEVTKRLVAKSMYMKLRKRRCRSQATDIEHIVKRLLQMRCEYRFVDTIEGLELKDIESFRVGDTEFFLFTQDHLDELAVCHETGNRKTYFQRDVSPFVKDNLLGKTCVQIAVYGEELKAKEIAYSKIRLAINVLRFVVTLFLHERISENTVKIHLRSESFGLDESRIRVNEAKKQVALTIGFGKRGRDKLPITQQRIDNLIEHYYFNDLKGLLKKDDFTEIEGAILSSVYWTGEAQNDFDYDSAYVKYWTALETFFSITKDDIRQSLINGIPALLAFASHGFIKVHDIGKMRKRLDLHYDLRSKILHRGMRGDIEPHDLNEICKYAGWCILSMLDCRAKGYERLCDIRTETVRLFKTVSKEDDH